MINIIGFSKDRAAQLDLFIRSFEYYSKEKYDIKIIYTYSNDEFKKGYDKLINYYIDIDFIKEQDFKNDVLKNIDLKKKYTSFFVDDIIFKNKFSINDNEFKIFENDKSILCLSLRLHPRLNYCYAANSPMKPSNKTLFEWEYESGDNNYPMSVDMNIFRTEEIYPLLYSLNYNNPNSLEMYLSMNPINKPKMICYDKSIIINNPCNKVQTNNPNKHGDIDAKYINDRYLDGYIIDLEEYKGIDNESCHKELPIKFIKKH
ncbi:hypothetical protein M0Q50_01130 [bacterium]|jgi:hypothetical protein|nr:hypothetical protein [bacterium]